ncbi:putative transcription factor interactor and regulator CCHC(Zn) family [Helianthus annuus]|nr:putative transcription factor interactor and regulator CCHC(Zn) family [Helianthus annuus]
MSSSSHHQNVGLYYKGNIPSVKAGDSPKTAFSGEKTKEPQTSSSSYNPGYHSSSSKANPEESEEVLCNIALKLKNSPAMSINFAKQQMSFLASVLESYEGLVAGKIGNSKLTKEDYDQIDPEEMELNDIRWCLASCITRAQRYMEITGKQAIGGSSTKLGFDKSKVTCFKCKQKGHFKRECNNSAVDGNEHPFNDDYYRKAIYHRSKEEPKKIENNPKEKSRACVVIHDDEGYDWSEILPEEDRVDGRFTAHGRTISKSKHSAFVPEIKEKTREEILNEKTYRERCIVGYKIEDMEREYGNAVSNKRWDKKRECYVNRDGEPVVHPSEIVFDEVLAVIPLSGEYYSNVEKDKTYKKRLDKIIRDAMTSSLRKRDDARMKKNVECMVEELKKVAEEVKEKEEKVVVNKDAVTEEQQVVEEDKTKEEEEEKKNESLNDGGDDAGVGKEEKKKDADQTETTNNTDVPITKCKKCVETTGYNNKLKSYHASSYVLERIFNIKPSDVDSEKNKKGISSEYHQVPPPFDEKFTFYDDEKLEKAFNMVDQLPDNIDVTYSKSDDSSDSEVVGKVVESVLKEESVETGKYESQDENEGSFHEQYLKSSKSEKNLNDDSKGLVYTMIGSDKLFLDVVFPIQNVISEKIDKVFKMVEIEKSEIPKFAQKCHKTFYNKPVYKKKNMKAGLG